MLTSNVRARASRPERAATAWRFYVSARGAYVCLVVFAISIVVLPACGNDADKNTLAEFPIAGDGDLLVMPVTIGGGTYRCYLDTASTNTIWDRSLRRNLGASIGNARISAPNGSVNTEAFRAAEVHVGRLALKSDRAFVTADLESIRRASGEDIQGVLGLDLLKASILEINFDDGMLRFLRAVPHDPGMRVVLAWSNDGLPSVHAQVGAMRVPFVVDTAYPGFSAGGLSNAVFDRLRRRGVLDVSGGRQLATLAGVSQSRAGVASQLAIGDYMHNDVEFDELPNDTVLGLSYWMRYRVIVDFPKAVMYLSPGKRFGAPAMRDRSGLHIWRVSGETLVHSVDPNSPAAIGKIMPGDRLLAIDGVDTSRGSLHPFRMSFCGTEKVVRLLVRRGDVGFNVVIDLSARHGGGR